VRGENQWRGKQCGAQPSKFFKGFPALLSSSDSIMRERRFSRHTLDAVFLSDGRGGFEALFMYGGTTGWVERARFWLWRMARKAARTGEAGSAATKAEEEYF
jgi:hypothetical protein